MNFDLSKALQRAPLRTKSGKRATLVAHLPAAKPWCRLVVMIDREVETYSEAGIYRAEKGEPSSWDLITDN